MYFIWKRPGVPVSQLPSQGAFTFWLRVQAIQGNLRWEEKGAEFKYSFVFKGKVG